MPASHPAPPPNSAPHSLADQRAHDPCATPGKRRYLDYEEGKAALRQAGLPVLPQPGSRYYLEGGKLVREENGRVLQWWKTE